jgi:hypothetical protein
MEYNHPPPSALQTCRESRQVALKQGKFLFGPRSSPICGLWFNTARDILFFPSHPKEGEDKDAYTGSWDILQSVVSTGMFISYLRHIAVDRHAGNHWHDVASMATEFIDPCDSLFIAMNHSSPGSGRDVRAYFLKDDDHFPPVIDESQDQFDTGRDEVQWSDFSAFCDYSESTCGMVTSHITNMYNDRPHPVVKQVNRIEFFEI